MIIGDFYINNFLVLGLVLAVVGGLGYVADVPGMLDGGSSQEEPSSEYNVSLLGASTTPGSSQVIRFVNEDGSVVSGAEVFINGEKAGTTGESGELAFEVPDSENLTVSASKSGVEVTRNFEVEGSQDRDQGEDDSDGKDEDSEQDSEGSDGSQDGENDNTDENSTEQENDTSQENETFQPIFIEKVSPENSDLSSSSFEMILDLGANNSNYQVSLGGEEKLSGEIDGNKTVTSNLEMPKNGTVGLYVEILKDDEVKASENYSLTYTSDSSGDDGSEVENNVTADLSVTDNVNVGNQFTLDASGSSGEIENYSWEFGDGSSEVTQSSETSHSYSSEGDYNVLLTVEGPNGSEDNITATITAQTDSASSTAPEINFISPVDGFETDQSSLGYEFDIENASDSSTYSILIDGSEASSGGLNEGTNSVQETVSIPSELFNTSVEVEQNGETYSSEQRTVNATEASANEPEFTLDNPGEGEVVETLDSQTSVSFEYEVISREWATEAAFTLSNESGEVIERPVSVSQGNHTEDIADLAKGNYTYKIVLSDGESKVSKSNEFEIRQVDPEYTVTQISPEDEIHIGEDNPDDFQEVDFNVSYETDTDGVLHFEIRALEDGSNTYTTDSGSGGEQEWTTEYNESDVVDSASVDILSGMEYHNVFENTFDVAIRYEWRSWITVDGETVKSTANRSLNVTEEPS